MKKIITIIALASMLGCVSCGEKAQGDSTPVPASNTTDAPTTETTADANTATEEATAEVVESKDESETYNWFGVEMYMPEGYNVSVSDGYPEAKFKDGDDLYTYSLYAYATEDVDSMTAESFKDKAYAELVVDYLIDKQFSCSYVKENTIESEEKVQVNGSEFIRQQGVYLLSDTFEEREAAYVAYFGIMEFEHSSKQPAAWMVLCSNTDDASKAEVARIADTAAKNCKPLK